MAIAISSILNASNSVSDPDPYSNCRQQVKLSFKIRVADPVHIRLDSDPTGTRQESIQTS